MRSHVVTGEQAFRDAVETRLQMHVPDPAALASIIEGFISAEEDFCAAAQLPGQTSLNVRLGKFVIRDDDLPIFDAMGAVASAVTASAATAGIAAPLVATALISLARLLWTFWRRGTALTETQVTVLGHLRLLNSATTAEILASIQNNKFGIGLQQIEEALTSLQEIELNNGQVLTLVSHSSDNHWRTHNI